uniref:Uncharacterized protein n=1 Tax=Arundo donax TaxID=35708 RepID=A0A0A9DDM3_ARUDO
MVLLPLSFPLLPLSFLFTTYSIKCRILSEPIMANQLKKRRISSKTRDHLLLMQAKTVFKKKNWICILQWYQKKIMLSMTNRSKQMFYLLKNILMKGGKQII